MKWDDIRKACDEIESSADPCEIFDICGFSGMQCRPGNCCYMNQMNSDFPEDDRRGELQ